MRKNPLKDYLTAEKMAEALGCSVSTVKTWAKDLEKRGLAIKVGRPWRIHKNAMPLYKNRSRLGRPSKKLKTGESK